MYDVLALSDAAQRSELGMTSTAAQRSTSAPLSADPGVAHITAPHHFEGTAYVLQVKQKDQWMFITHLL